MVNANKIETIRKNIQTSKLLSDHEKADWLNLLELMNDKQLGELEEILAAEPQPTPVQASTAAPALNPNMPPLSHIANIPTGVDMGRAVLPPPPPKPRPQFTAPPPPVPQPQKPLTVRPTPSPNLNAPASLNAQQQLIQRLGTKKELPPQPPSKPEIYKAPVAPHSESQAVFSIQNTEDLRKMNLQTLRSFSYGSIMDCVHKAVTKDGYFPVLHLIEASLLFQTYINSGISRLRDPDLVRADAFTQPELEFMTDLLRNMRFNSW
ncbi:MAG TPA: hypothetical protein VHQ41_01355 [Patescibacteria group bacterium]|jgi:hypothetical protein|nr:hypothetical protein [Patescibacteria group bacterium]